MCSQTKAIEISKLILIYNCSGLSRMRSGEWSLLLLRLLSPSERMKGHSLFALFIFFFLNQSHLYKFRSSLSKNNRSFLFLRKSFLNLSVKRVNRTCQSIDMFEILLQKVAFSLRFSYLEIEMF